MGRKDIAKPEASLIHPYSRLDMFSRSVHYNSGFLPHLCLPLGRCYTTWASTNLREVASIKRKRGSSTVTKRSKRIKQVCILDSMILDRNANTKPDAFCPQPAAAKSIIATCWTSYSNLRIRFDRRKPHLRYLWPTHSCLSSDIEADPRRGSTYMVSKEYIYCSTYDTAVLTSESLF